MSKKWYPDCEYVLRHTIHCAQGFTFNHVAFDALGVTKHNFTYLMLHHICSNNTYIYFSNYQTIFFLKYHQPTRKVALKNNNTI
jgi:hypothetical protein